MSTDFDALYAISLATADAGADASRLYHDKHLVGAIYSAPYATLDPDLVVVAADEEGVGGFVLAERGRDRKKRRDGGHSCETPRHSRVLPCAIFRGPIILVAISHITRPAVNAARHTAAA